MFERPQSGERAVLVHLTFRQVQDSACLQELHDLSLASGMIPIAKVTSIRRHPDPKYFIGKGKLSEIADLVQLHQAEVVVFNHELSPSQERNVENVLKCRVMSRTGVILAIFANRARTHEGKLQVELALLEHMSTRLVRGWTHLERQKGGIGIRGGPGETQLEVDRRLLRDRMLSIKKRLVKLRRQRGQSRQARQRAEVLTVALVGYTNAGKSTLFNTLTGAHTIVADQLFATLDPTLRAIEIPVVGRCVLADTVGFINHLPHTLVDAFKATLEETSEATLLLHVVDASSPRKEEHIQQVNEVLAEIDAESVPQLIVYNKIDLLPPNERPQERVERNKAGEITKVWVSSLKNDGIDLLREGLQGRLSIERVTGSLSLEPSQGQLRAQLYALQAVHSECVNEKGGWDLVIETTKFHWAKLCQQYGDLGDALHPNSKKR